jgi:hypothetical protein
MMPNTWFFGILKLRIDTEKMKGDIN